MHGRLHGKVALILEGESEIAAAAAVRFAREGCRLALCGRDAARLEEVATAVADTGGSAYVLQADPSHDTQLSAVIDESIGQFGTIDVLVCCTAGRGAKSQAGAERAVAKALVAMAARGGGSIVVVAPADAAAAVLAGIVDCVEKLALEGAARGVRVNVVLPGLVATEELLGGLGGPTGRKRAEESVPLGRLAQPDEVAAAIAFLASDDAGYITGTTVTVDGGRDARKRAAMSPSSPK